MPTADAEGNRSNQEGIIGIHMGHNYIGRNYMGIIGKVSGEMRL